jgi:hypothetical protein
MALTKDEAVSKFRRQWRGMGEERIDKFTWLLKHAPEDKDILCECYLCQYVLGYLECERCPIEWGEGKRCYDEGTLYYQWENCNPGPEQNALAIRISELPEKETT